MKKRLRKAICFAAIAVLLVSGSIAPASATGPTFVSGDITADTTWFLDSSPYIVTGDVTVRNNATLFIEPGVTVKFNRGTGLTVGPGGSYIDRGSLIAFGAPHKRITFISNETSPAPRDWKGIRFRVTDSSILRGCTIQHAENGIELYNRGWWEESITDNIISDNNVGIIGSVSNATITGNIIRNNLVDGISIYIGDGLAYIANNFIVDNGDFGIYAVYAPPPIPEYWEPRLTVVNNTITGHGSGVYDGVLESFIINNIIVRNAWGIRSWTPRLTVSYNDFWNNTTNYYFYFVPVITNNIWADPQFIGAGDYHLKTDSACIDAGTSNGAPAADIDGEARPYDGNGDDVAKFDIGADEYHPLLFGTVTDVFGKPVSNAKVSIFQDYLSKAEAGTGTDGKYKIGGIPSGDFRIRVEPPDGSELAYQWYDNESCYADASVVSLEPGERLIGFRLYQGGRISGKVFYEGAPVSGAFIFIKGENSSIFTEDTVMTGADGSYITKPLPNGNYRVEVAYWPPSAPYYFEVYPEVITIVAPNNVGDISFYLAPADTTSPDTITNLAMDSRTSTSITLKWTAPGDDGGVGTAAEYDLRYSTSPILSDADWAAAIQIPDEPVPLAAGTAQSYTVTGLNPETSYHFAIKARDEVSNWSSLSNRLNVYTLIVGDITKDGTVNIFDLVKVGKAFGSVPGDSNWDPEADLKADNVINIFDLVVVGKNFGRSVPPPQSY